MNHYKADMMPQGRGKTPLFNLLGERIVEILQKGKMDSLLIRNNVALTQFDRFMDASSRPVAECHLLITPITAHVKLHINEAEQEHHLGQRL